MIQRTHEANKTIIEYLPHRKEWRLLYPWWPKWGFPCEFAACVLKKRFYERMKEKWTQLALLSIIEDRLCWVRDDEYRTFPTKTNLCSWAHSGAMLRALKIQISKVVAKRVQETVFHDLHHILGVLLASLFAHLKPCSCLQGQIWTRKQKRCQHDVKIEVDALPWRLVTRMRTFELGSELRIMYYPRNKRSTYCIGEGEKWGRSKRYKSPPCMRNGVSFYKFCKKKFLRFDVGAFLLGDVFITSNDASIDGTTLTLLRMLSILLSTKNFLW